MAPTGAADADRLAVLDLNSGILKLVDLVLSFKKKLPPTKKHERIKVVFILLISR